MSSIKVLDINDDNKILCFFLVVVVEIDCENMSEKNYFFIYNHKMNWLTTGRLKHVFVIRKHKSIII